MRKQLVSLLVRWVANIVGLFVAANVLGLINYGGSLAGLFMGGLILAILNSVLKPLLVILTLPAIALTLGVFLVVINGLVVYIASALFGPLQVDSIGMAVLAGMVIGLVNYIVNLVLEAKQ